MKICRIVDFFPTEKEIVGDLGPNYYYITRGTTKNGYEENVICTRKSGQPAFEEIEGIKVHRVSSNEVKHPRRDNLWGSFAKNSLKKVLEIKPDFVVGHNALHYGIASGKKKLEEKNIKLITHLHIWIDNFIKAEHLPFSVNFSSALRDRFIDFTNFLQFKHVLKESDLVIACDKSTKKNSLNYFPDKPTYVVYNGVDFKRFKKIKSNLKDEMQADKLLLNISRPVPWKGLQYLLRAMPLINKEFNDLKLLLLGFKREDYKVYIKWLEDIAKKEKLNNIVFGGRIPYFDLPKYYSGSDCFVAPSYPDPSPKTVYEAQACNTPIVGVNGGGIPEIFGKESGLLFQKRNPKDLADKVIQILNNSKKFQNGRKAIEGKATWKKCIEDTLKVYEKIN